MLKSGLFVYFIDEYAFRELVANRDNRDQAVWAFFYFFHFQPSADKSNSWVRLVMLFPWRLLADAMQAVVRGNHVFSYTTETPQELSHT